MTGKPRLTKRKLQTSNDENIARKPQLNKASKERSDKMDMTEKLNEALLEEVKENEVAIAKLEEKKEEKHVEIIKELKQKIGILE